MTDEPENSTLARIDVRRAPAPTGPAVTPAPGRVLSVTRIAVPAFEVLYRDAEGAYEDGVRIRDDRAFELEREVDEDPGAEVVLEFGLPDFAFSVTLLFRVVGRARGRTMLEWWPRRQTDPKLLDLWIDAVSPRPVHTPSSTPADDAARARAIEEAVALYRRSLSSNPFDVLGIHWTSDGNLVREASRALAGDLDARLRNYGADPEVSEYLRRTLEYVQRSEVVLSTLDGRREVRRQMVSEKELRGAHRQAEFLVQMAEREGRAEALDGARRMLEELRV